MKRANKKLTPKKIIMVVEGRKMIDNNFTKSHKTKTDELDKRQHVLRGEKMTVNTTLSEKN